ncbi:MAG TPA: hypothetical protein VGZ22_08010, partial [Isosphaeraceae bacterium]|nr:hypothetical protein [Isosphaeraceae bacterium]
MKHRANSLVAFGLLAGLVSRADDPTAAGPTIDAEKAARTADKDETPPAKAATNLRKKAGKTREARRAVDEPPPCPHKKVEPGPRRPAPMSMPEMFSRMGENFAQNPAMGFPSFVN